MAEALLERESLDGAEIDEIIKQFGISGDGELPSRSPRRPPDGR